MIFTCMIAIASIIISYMYLGVLLYQYYVEDDNLIFYFDDFYIWIV